MIKLLIAALGGALGAMARYGVSGVLQKLALQRFGRALPLGTFTVNALGCLVIGGLMVLVHEKRMSETARVLWVTGFLGAFTTFSAFGYETLDLLQERELRLAAVNVLANVSVGLAAAWLGQLITSALLRP